MSDEQVVGPPHHARRVLERVLVANRGEIASRVFATCRRRGIETVAVFSDADAHLPYVGHADVAVRLPGVSPAETYLRADLLIDAARRAGADSVHPGYGFLSENATFARAVIEAGLVWIGPSPDAIEAMGSKVRAKQVASEAGVPVLASLTTPSDADLPLLVKASAGGGGRGMRIVRSVADLEAEVAAARAEAESAFGDGSVFVEPYVESGRHVEVQIWGDRAGNISVLGARDCSVQRRHQKVIEESPPPGVGRATLDAMYAAARAIGGALSYCGAGTVEFLLDATHERTLESRDEEETPARFWFLEVNTRLQVEHPVTEAVTGLDLVGLQLDAATALHARTIGGAADPDGHAIEVRLYAEDPQEDYRPQSGRLLTFEVEHDVTFESRRSGVRLDATYAAGSDVTPHYDPMLAKVIAHGADRTEVALRLAGVLRRARIHGLRTNRDQLVSLLTSSDFLGAGHPAPRDSALEPGLDTSLAERVPRRSAPATRETVVAAALMLAAADAARRTVQQGVPAAWRNVPSQPQLTTFEGHEPVEWWGTRDGFVVDGVTVLDVSPTHARLEVDGVATETRGHWSDHRAGGPREVWVDGPGTSACLREVPRFADPADAVASGSLLGPMPGTVVKVAVESGDEVAAGDAVLVLEAMKMQHTVTAPHAGTVTDLRVQPGQQVAAGEVLAVVAESATENEAEESR